MFGRNKPDQETLKEILVRLEAANETARLRMDELAKATHEANRALKNFQDAVARAQASLRSAEAKKRGTW